MKQSNVVTKSAVNSTNKHNRKTLADSTKEAVMKTAEVGTDLGKSLIAKMRRGTVEFTFINRLGKQITTAGTLIKSKIPTTRKVAGATKPRTPEHVVFYDTKHGVRRQFDRNQVVAIFA